MEVRNAWEYRRLFQEPSLCSTHVRGGLRGPKRINPHRGDDAISIRMPVAACSLEDESQPGDLRKVGLFLHGLESNPGSSLQTEEEAGLP